MNIETTCNTPDDILFSNIEINSKRPNEWLKSSTAHDGHAVIVGGAPSAADWIQEIRMRQFSGQKIFALNNAARWLLTEHHIKADYCVVVDARDCNTGFVGHAKQDLLASQCHPSLFSDSAILWHQEYPNDMDRFNACLPETQPEHALIGGGTTVGLSAMVLTYAMGYRSIHLYGYDSSYRDDHCHAYEQNDSQRIECINTVAGRSFKTTLAMAKQAELFPQLSDSLIELGCTITIRGDGLLPWVSKMSAVAPEEISEQDKYLAMWSRPEYRNVSPGEQVVPLFFLAANPLENDTVIDFGAGTGRAAKLIKSRCTVSMLDFADNCLDDDVRALIDDRLTFTQHDLTKPIGIHAKYGFCTDVMEHIEPDNVDLVLDNIFTSVDSVFFQISTVPDNMGALIGHPLHLTVKDGEWWQEKLSRYGKISFSYETMDAVIFYVTNSTT